MMGIKELHCSIDMRPEPWLPLITDTENKRGKDGGGRGDHDQTCTIKNIASSVLYGIYRFQEYCYMYFF
jgi:hypothetical protein